MKLYALKDVKAHKFGNIWTADTDEAAMRNFDAIKKQTDTLPGMYPGDFELWYLGIYDENTGKIYVEEPKFIDGGVKE